MKNFVLRAYLLKNSIKTVSYTLVNILENLWEI